MAAVLPSKIFQMSRAKDPKQAIFEALGNAVDKIHVRNNLILVATYIAPEVITSGTRKDGSKFELIKAEVNKAEDLYMGCLGLVLKKGPQAFKDDERLNIFWDKQDAEVGSWVLFRYSSAWEQHLNGVSVRFVEDREIKATIDDPTLIVSKPTVVIE